MSGRLQTGVADELRLRRLLLPLVPIYRAALSVKNAAYARHWVAGRQLQWPVISVGNLSVGGAGKTPLVIRLATLLAERGLSVDVLSRGYGRRSAFTEQVAIEPQAEPGETQTPGHNSVRHSADRYGDEPLLIARASGVPVYVGASRHAAGLLAEQRATSSAGVHLLDDGFQHRKLARAVDIVVLHRSDFTGGLLPAGRLREPLSALRRASVAVLRVEDASFETVLRERFPTLPVWLMRREILVPLHRSPTLAFCGIAHAPEFFASLTSAGVHLLAAQAFPDHHAYTDRDIAALVHRAQATGAVSLLTTEKDMVRLRPLQRAQLGQFASLAAVPLVARLLDEPARVVQLLELAGLSL